MIYFTKIDPARGMARFYALDLQRTLFGELALVREWGRIGQAGQMRRAYYAEEKEAVAAFKAAQRRRRRRGYVQRLPAAQAT